VTARRSPVSPNTPHLLPTYGIPTFCRHPLVLARRGMKVPSKPKQEAPKVKKSMTVLAAKLMRMLMNVPNEVATSEFGSNAGKPKSGDGPLQSPSHMAWLAHRNFVLAMSVLSVCCQCHSLHCFTAKVAAATIRHARTHMHLFMLQCLLRNDSTCAHSCAFACVAAFVEIRHHWIAHQQLSRRRT
jgi:hypothetical protein